MIPIGDIIAHRLHDVVQNGTLNVDYTFARDRYKNRLLRRKYIIDDKKMISILLSITGEHYLKSEPSDNVLYPNDTVHFFNKTELLMPRYQENASLEEVSLYIKIVWPDGHEPMFIISFHENHLF